MKELTKKIIRFRDKRNWKKFHTPLNLAISLQLEASEVLECFQWKSEKESAKEFRQADKKTAIKEEIADVFAYVLLLSDSLNIDLKKAFEEKMEKNARKYPVAKAKGNAKKYTQL
ncbi:MAG: nucleotide pyrophosphohydrolase [Patescibacteria group bacterium]|nr:nucleotide pyrophosphohydrolase [Patescibacteria group bacterium]